MLKKSTVAIVTSMATALSVFSPLTVNAVPLKTDIDSAINVIPLSYERSYAEEPQTTTMTSDSFQWAYTEPEESTIPRREFTVTTVAPADDNQGIFPMQKSRDITVKVVDAETGEPIPEVQVRFLETESPTSNQIKRELGYWCSSDSETFTLDDIDYTLENNSSMFLLTAVLEHIPEGYSYNGRMYGGSVVDHIVDLGEWHASGQEIYHDTGTLTIRLDRTCDRTFNAKCSVIDSVTGNLIEDAEVTLARLRSDGYREPVDMWTTDGNAPHVTENINVLLPNNYSSELWEFVVDHLPYDKYDYTLTGLSCSVEIKADTPEDVEFKIYVDPDGNQVNNTNTRPPQYTYTTTAPPASLDIRTTNTTTTTTAVICGGPTGQTTAKNDTGTRPPWMTYTQTTVAETRQCDGCGKEINVSDGVNTPLGMFLCTDCRTAGMGGTTFPTVPLHTETTTQTTVSGDSSVAHPPATTVTTSMDGLYHGNFQAVCFAIDATTGEKISGAELQLVDESGNIIESWYSSEKCSHQIDVEYTMDSQDASKTYQLVMNNLPDGYKYSGIDDQTAEGLLPCYNTIDCGFKGINSFAVYVCPEDYVFPDTGEKPWQTTKKTDSATQQTTSSNAATPVMTVTTLAVGKIELNSKPTKTNYTVGEKLDLSGLDVSMIQETGVNGKDGINTLFSNVNPVDYPEAFIVNTYGFDSTKAGTYTIKVKCSDDYKADYMVNNTVEFNVNVTESSTLIGDANCDNNVNISDTILIMQAISNPSDYQLTESGKANADVYNRGDGITNMDALVIQEVQAHIISASDLPVSR